MGSDAYPRIDISKIPFSRYGSYLAVSQGDADRSLMIHNVQRRFGEDHAFSLALERNGTSLEFTAEASPSALRIVTSEGEARICITGDTTLAVESTGPDLKFEQVSPNGYGVVEAEDRFKIISVPHRSYTSIGVFQGSGVLDGPVRKSPGRNFRNHRQHLRVSCDNGRALASLEISQVEARTIPAVLDMDVEIASAASEWENFFAGMPEAPEAHREFAAVTWYNLWSCFVRKQDVYKYDAMLMSKKFMSSVWSWDHCFNAMAMAPANETAALEQFLLPFELQAETGALPDMVNPNTEIVWGVTKPPIHGWCFARLMEVCEFERPVLEKVYSHLERWTEWWMTYRDSDGDGLPEYPQGCDSGWDNSTLFDIGYFLASPDLSAYLVLQMKALAHIAGKLNRAEAAEGWEGRANALLGRLNDTWDGEQFVARLSGTGEFQLHPTSLLSLMPIVLGDLIDTERFAKLVDQLERDFLTENGPATEALGSDLYESDGYWRGPIWAPSTYLLVDGLRRGGRGDLAAKIAGGFCTMAKDKAEGNFENFDAVTGKGLRAPGYTWTASVYLMLLWEYLRTNSAENQKE